MANVIVDTVKDVAGAVKDGASYVAKNLVHNPGSQLIMTAAAVVVDPVGAAARVVRRKKTTTPVAEEKKAPGKTKK